MKTKTTLLVAAIVLGLSYGYVSASRNQNPYDPSEQHLAWHWQPSPVWLPGYLLCKFPPNGFGIAHTKSGYTFKSEGGRIAYFLGSSVVGGAMGCLAGCVVLVLTRRKKKAVESPHAAET